MTKPVMVCIGKAGQDIFLEGEVFKPLKDKGVFYEHIINKILDDLIKILKPKKITVTGNFTSRGGISTSVTAGL